ncbi:hypothetical protein [Bacillus cereus]|uniref:hypothetical protein n=1 Tax=Bacillus cereus TaxID=1396 RepID=UPI003CFAAAC4
MNFAVYFYDENKRYTHTEMIPFTEVHETDKEGNLISTSLQKDIPENATDVFPSDLAGDPAFEETSKTWVPQKMISPFSTQNLEEKLKTLEEKLDSLAKEIQNPPKNPDLVATIESHTRRIRETEELLTRTRAYLVICFPNVAHFFRD